MVKTHLLATDRSLSVLVEATSRRIVRVAYTPYGTLNNAGSLQSHLGFNGEFREGRCWYHLGNGHRVYNPVLRRFHSPDRLSPFDEGGLNPYAYCVGDPINYRDPTGRAAQPIHIITIAITVLGLISGFKGLIAPLIQAQVAKSVTATAIPSTWWQVKKKAIVKSLHHYFEKSPGMAGVPSGGIGLTGDVAGLVNPVLSFPTVGLSMKEELAPTTAIDALTYVGFGIGGYQAVTKVLTNVVPKLATSKFGRRLAIAVHGRKKVRAAIDGRMKQEIQLSPAQIRETYIFNQVRPGRGDAP